MYLTKMEIDLENIDKEDNNTWMKIHKAIDKFHFKEVTLFTEESLEHIKNSPNVPQTIPYEIIIITKNICIRKLVFADFHDMEED